jgi:hypothetical protein
MVSATLAFQSDGEGGAACAKDVAKSALTRSKHLRMGDVPPKLDVE